VYRGKDGQGSALEDVYTRIEDLDFNRRKAE